MLWHVKSNRTEIDFTMSETIRSSQVGIEYLLEYRLIALHISLRMVEVSALRPLRPGRRAIITENHFILAQHEVQEHQMAWTTQHHL